MVVLVVWVVLWLFGCEFGCLVVRLFGGLGVWLLGYLVAWLLGGVVAWWFGGAVCYVICLFLCVCLFVCLFGCLVEWLWGCVVVGLRGCVVAWCGCVVWLCGALGCFGCFVVVCGGLWWFVVVVFLTCDLANVSVLPAPQGEKRSRVAVKHANLGRVLLEHLSHHTSQQRHRPCNQRRVLEAHVCPTPKTLHSKITPNPAALCNNKRTGPCPAAPSAINRTSQKPAHHTEPMPYNTVPRITALKAVQTHADQRSRGCTLQITAASSNLNPT